MKLIIIAVMVSALLTSCATGPTAEQIAAQAEAKRQEERRAEEARRAEEEARREAFEAQMAKIRAAEQAGDDAAKGGHNEQALALYTVALNLAPRRSDTDQQIRQKIANFVATLTHVPDPPEEARRHSIRALAKFKTGVSDEYRASVSEMEQALLLAPWFASAYHDLGLIQEGAGQFDDAIGSLKLYLLAAPKSPDAKAVQARIYELEVGKEDAEKNKRLSGRNWINRETDRRYSISIEGNKFEAVSDVGKIYRGIKKGLSIEGTLTIPTDKKTKFVRDGAGPVFAETPGEVVPFSGRIGEDGASITLIWVSSSYQYNPTVGVRVFGKEESRVTLTREF